ncbi:MAG: DivIVA domain-containing protein [Clostridia bacterium]|nr:DivIVA domain-containing protein [Clostridia bacterium]
MNLPEEIRNKEFSISLRGYNIPEVEDYIEMLLEKYDTLYNENAELADRLSQLSARYETLVSSQRQAESLVKEAEEEAATIIANAKNATAAQRTGTGSFSDLLRIDEKIAAKTAEYNDLCNKVEVFKNTLFELYSAHINSLSSIEAKPIAVTAVQPEVKPEKPEEPKRAEPITEKKCDDAEATVEFAVPKASEKQAEKVSEPQTVSAKAEARTGHEEFAFTTGLKITREPAGSASSTKSFSSVKERLDNANAEANATVTKKQKKFF